MCFLILVVIGSTCPLDSRGLPSSLPLKNYFGTVCPARGGCPHTIWLPSLFVWDVSPNTRILPPLWARDLQKWRMLSTSDTVRYLVTRCSFFNGYIEYAPLPTFIWRTDCFLPRHTRSRHPAIYGQGGRCPLRGFLKIVTNKQTKSSTPLSLKAILNLNLKKPMRKKTESVGDQGSKLYYSYWKSDQHVKDLISLLLAFCVPPSPKPIPHPLPRSLTVYYSFLRSELVMH